MRCFSQLSLLTGQLRQLIPIDPLRCELPLKVLAHLDANSLCRVAQVRKQWKPPAGEATTSGAEYANNILGKMLKCGWDCLFLNTSAPYASTHPLLPLHSHHTPSLHRSHAPNGNWTLNLSLAGRRKALKLSSRHTPSCTRTTVCWSRNRRCRHLLLPNSVLLSAL